jgi:hypothetical protein
MQLCARAAHDRGILTAVRDGLEDLDASISRCLPDFRVQSIFESRPQDRIMDKLVEAGLDFRSDPATWRNNRLNRR